MKMLRGTISRSDRLRTPSIENPSATQNPIIEPYDDAMVHYQMKGDGFENQSKGGVFQGLGYHVDNENKTFTVESGYGTRDGREFEVEDHEIDMIGLTGIKYCVVYVEIDCRNITKNRCEIKLAYAGANYPSIDRGDLVSNNEGIGRMELYSFIFNSTEVVPFQSVKRLFYEFEDGTAESVRALDSDAKLNGREVNNLLYWNADRWKRANRAIHADLGKSIGTSGRWQAIDDVLGIRDGNAGESINLTMVTKGSWRIEGVDKKDNIDNTKKFLVENQTYKFYYSSQGNPIPSGAKVIGVLISGKVLMWQWHSWQLFDWTEEWRKFAQERMWFTPKYPIHDSSGFFGIGAAEGYRPPSEAGTMMSGDIWNNSRSIYIGSNMGQKDNVIGVNTFSYGTYCVDPAARHENYGGPADVVPSKNNLARLVATMTFKGQSTRSPYIEVSVEDDFCILPDLTIRLVYIMGRDRPGQVASQPYNLNPPLEGGQT